MERHRRATSYTHPLHTYRNNGTTVGLAGWVLADMMLGLLLVFLISLKGVEAPPIAVAPTATSAVSPIPTPAHPSAARPTATAIAPTEGPAFVTSRAAVSPATPARRTMGALPPGRVPPSPSPCRTNVLLVKHELHAPGGPGGPTPGTLAALFAPYRGQRAGIVLTYGHAPTVAEGIALATQVNAALRRQLPEMFTTDTVMEAIRWSDAVVGAVEFQVYFIDHRCG